MLDASNPHVSWFNHHVSCFSWWFTTNLQDPIAFTFRLAPIRLKSLCFMLISHHFSPFFMVSTARRCPIPWPTPGLPCAARWTSTPTAARHRSATTPSARAEPEAERARTEGRWWFWMKRNGIATQCDFLNGVCRNWTCVLKLWFFGSFHCCAGLSDGFAFVDWAKRVWRWKLRLNHKDWLRLICSNCSSLVVCWGSWLHSQ